MTDESSIPPPRACEADGQVESAPREVSLPLPWRRPPLNHNDRLFRMHEAKVVAEIREGVGWLAKAARLPRAERLVVQLHYAPGRQGRQDAMNWTATSKPAIDGLVDAGLVADDDTTHVHELTPEIHFPPEPGPRCWLTLQLHFTPAPVVWGLAVTFAVASRLRRYRVDEGCTWRDVAFLACQDFRLDVGADVVSEGNPIVGRDLCTAAARVLGEDPDDAPWN